MYEILDRETVPLTKVLDFNGLDGCRGAQGGILGGAGHGMYPGMCVRGNPCSRGNDKHKASIHIIVSTFIQQVDFASTT